MKNAKGGIVAVPERATEASDLEELVRELTRAQREHAELIDNIDGIVWESSSSDLHFTFVSKQAERLLGYPTRCWLEDPNFWVNHLHPDDRAWAPAFCVKATSECRPHELEYRMVAADGRTVWLRDIVTVIVEEGRPVKLRGIMVDVTEQHRNKERLQHMVSLLRATLDSTADGLLAVNPSGLTVAYNRRFQDLWRLSDEMMGSPRNVLTAPPIVEQILDPEPYLARLRELDAALDQEGLEDIELRDGRVIERSAFPQRQGDAIIGRVWSFRDVTQRVRAEQERERLLSEAHEAIRVRDDFLSIASHELKTPLTPLSLHLQVMQQRAAAGQPIPSALVEKTLTQVKRMSGLISDLLDVSRIEAGRLELELKSVPLRELVREVVADFRPISTHHVIECDEPAEEVIVQGDRGRLAQVLTNLLENAIKYSPTGGLVRVMVSRGPSEVVVSVADSGIGIPADQQVHLFERFFRARNAPISGFGGLGLGLYICRDIVERHGGRIWVESKVGTGSTFRFTLPVVSARA